MTIRTFTRADWADVSEIYRGLPRAASSPW